MIRNTVRILTVLCALCLFAGVAFAQGGTDQSSKQGTTAEKKTKKSTKASSKKIDVNSASKEELAALPGIGDATAQKIIDGRPYKTKRDLLTKNIVTNDEYDKIKDQIVAHGGKTKKGAATTKTEEPKK